MRETAIVLACGLYQSPNGKAAHGLVRGSDRFEVLAVVDDNAAGRDAGEALDGVHRGIPVVATIEEALTVSETRPRYCIVGIATHGGRFTEAIRHLILQAIGKGLSIVNGLHDTCAADPAIAAAAEAAGVELVDVRASRPRHELHFWEGRIKTVKAPRLAVLGTDCALGKRTTTRMLVETLNARGVRAEMIYTGQTGWMQGVRFGFILDSVPNDYVSGELEHAIVECDRQLAPDVIVIEGQSALRNPSGPCGAELLLSGGARGVVLQHAVGREFFEGYESDGLRIPSLASEIELIGLYGARTIAVTLNGRDATAAELIEAQQRYRSELDIPVIRPLEEGLEGLLAEVRAYIDHARREQAA